MKNIFLFAVLSLLAVSCTKESTQNENNIYNSVYYANGLNEHYYYDDILTAKPLISFDTTELRKEIDLMIPPKTILDNHGPGYKNLYFMLMIGDNTIKYRLLDGILLRPEMGWLSSTERKMILSQHSDNKNTFLVNLFLYEYKDVNKLFNVQRGTIDGKKVPSIKLYEVSTIISKDGIAIKPWNIKELNFNSFRPQITQDYSYQDFEYPYDFASGPFISGGYNEFRKKINYPLNAKKNKIEGRVLVRTFISETGNVVGTQLLKGLGYGCEEEVLKAIKKTNFYLPEKKKFLVDLPVELALNDGESLDLTSTLFELRPRELRVGKKVEIHFNLDCTSKDKPVQKKGWYVYMYINDKMVYAATSIPVKSNEFYFSWIPQEKGLHTYKILIDPGNILQERNRLNNIILGTFEVK